MPKDSYPMKAPAKGKLSTAKVGPDKQRPMSSDKYDSRGNGTINNESKGFAKDMPGGSMRSSQ